MAPMRQSKVKQIKSTCVSKTAEFRIWRSGGLQSSQVEICRAFRRLPIDESSSSMAEDDAPTRHCRNRKSRVALTLRREIIVQQEAELFDFANFDVVTALHEH